MSDIYKESQRALAGKDRVIAKLQGDLAEAERQKILQQELIWKDIAQEIQTQYPYIKAALLGEIQEWRPGAPSEIQRVSLLTLVSAKSIRKSERRKIERWLKLRIKSDHVRLIVTKPS